MLGKSEYWQELGEVFRQAKPNSTKPEISCVTLNIGLNLQLGDGPVGTRKLAVDPAFKIELAPKFTPEETDLVPRALLI